LIQFKSLATKVSPVSIILGLTDQVKTLEKVIELTDEGKQCLSFEEKAMKNIMGIGFLYF
jgi:hypothetical protein